MDILLVSEEIVGSVIVDFEVAAAEEELFVFFSGDLIENVFEGHDEDSLFVAVDGVFCE